VRSSREWKTSPGRSAPGANHSGESSEAAHLKLVLILNHFARTYADQKQYAKAEPFLRRALQIAE